MLLLDELSLFIWDDTTTRLTSLGVENLVVYKYLNVKALKISHVLYKHSTLTWDGYKWLLHMHELLMIISCTRLVNWNARFICRCPFVRHHARNLCEEIIFDDYKISINSSFKFHALLLWVCGVYTFAQAERALWIYSIKHISSMTNLILMQICVWKLNSWNCFIIA